MGMGINWQLVDYFNVFHCEIPIGGFSFHLTLHDSKAKEDKFNKVSKRN